jgi:hypothetical protein
MSATDTYRPHRERTRCFEDIHLGKNGPSSSFLCHGRLAGIDCVLYLLFRCPNRQRGLLPLHHDRLDRPFAKRSFRHWYRR